MQALSKSCLSLSRLDLDECVLITDASLASLSSHCPRLSRSAHYQARVTISRVTHKSYIINTGLDSSRYETPTFCKIFYLCSLRSLSLSHCELITDEGIRQLGGSQSRERLTTLELDNCPLVTDRGLEHLVACKNLKRIEL